MLKKSAKKNKNGAKRGDPDLMRETMVAFSRIPVGLPLIYRCRLVYSSYKNMSPAGGAIDQQLVSGNSVFDPDATGVGEQPYWFDQLSAIYLKYRVVRSKIELTVVNTASVNMRVVVLPLYSTTTPADIYEASEYPMARYCEPAIIGSGSNIVRMKSQCTTAKIIGISEEAALIEDSYASAYTTNPSGRWYWMILAQATGGFTSTLGSIVSYRVTYDVIWFGQRPNGDSVALPLDEILRAQHERALSAPKDSAVAQVTGGEGGVSCSPETNTAADMVPFTVTVSGPRLPSASAASVLQGRNTPPMRR